MNLPVVVRRSIVVAVLAWLASASGTVSRAATAVAPILPSVDGLHNFEGNSESGSPFHLEPYGIASARYQQVYAGGGFPQVPMLIDAIAFRPDGLSGAPFNSTLPDVQINLSTTSRTVNNLSLAFADNVGANEAVVHSGPLALSSAWTGPAGGPKNFDIVVPLATPYLYDPRAGSLLLDIRNFGGGAATQLDAFDLPNDSVARVGTTTIDGVDSTHADMGNTRGLTTLFSYTPIVKEYKYAFTGTITEVDDAEGRFNGSLQPGMPVKGTFNLFDLGYEFAGILGGGAGGEYSGFWFDYYNYPKPPAAELPVSLAVEVGGHVYQTDAVTSGRPYGYFMYNENKTGFYADIPGDVYHLQTIMAMPEHFDGDAARMHLFLSDSTGTSFDTSLIPPPFELMLPNLANIDSMFGRILAATLPDTTNLSTAEFQITSLRLIPEPSGIALVAGPLALFALARRRARFALPYH